MNVETIGKWMKFQCEVLEWSTHNFGEQTTLAPLVGMFEEVGEFYQALDADDVGEMCDAIHDAVIYMMDFTARRQIRVSEILSVMDSSDGSRFTKKHTNFARYLHKTQGKIAHSALKMEQNIRGNEQHRTNLVEGLADWMLLLIILMPAESYGVEMSLDHVLLTWQKVSQRDWRKNPQTGTKE